MERFFKISQRGSSVSQELRAGFTTFLAMAYVIAVNPALLMHAGIPVSAVVTATCIGSGVMTIIMGLYSNRPLACATGMGINAIISFTLPALTGGDWHTSMAIVFVEGIAILLFVLCGLREAIMDAIPPALRHAIAAGLGLFIAFLGLVNGKIIVNNDSTLVALGQVGNPFFIVGVVSIAATIILYAMHIKGEILWGIIIATVVGIPLGVTQLPKGIISGLDFSSFGAPFLSDAHGTMGIVKVLTTPALLFFAFSLMMSDFFDTMGTAVAVAKQGEFLTEDGKVKDIRQILVVDSAAAAAGGLFGASSITTFLESSVGAADGGRTGFSPIVTGILFILAAFFTPLISVVSSAATCGALVMVGFFMMSEITSIDWNDVLEAFPAFIIIIGIPLTYSIANGIGLGFIAYTVLALCTNRAKKIKPLMWITSLAFLLSFIFF